MSQLLRRTAGTLWAIFRQRCPQCHTGRMFRGLFTMNDPCPHCGLLFQREEGYFLGAMYPSYLLSCVVMLGLYFGLSAVLVDWDGLVVAGLAIVAFLPFLPSIFRYSRVLWVYFERAVCPSDISAGVYEKMRLREIKKQE